MVRQALDDPAIELVLADRLDPIIEPFAGNARLGAIALAIAATVVVALTVLATMRLTRSFEALADAADAVSMGDLGQRLEPGGRDEVRRVSRAFNAMTENLRRMLRERSQREALAAMGELAGALAHQVRSPLTAMRLDLQRVEAKLKQAERERALVTRAIDQLDRLERAVVGGLRMAKTSEVSFETLDLMEPLQRAIDGVGHEFRARGASLHVQRSEERPCVRGDAATLEQVFANILLNAAEALADGRSATVRTGRENGDVFVVVEDEGCGMDRSTLARVFEPLFSTKADGTGIGLAVVHRIVAAHGGSVNVESEPGRGTAVRLTFPAASGRTT